MKLVRALPLLLATLAACATHLKPLDKAPLYGTAPKESDAAASHPAAEGAGDASEDESAPVPVRRDNPSWGRSDATVTLVEFADLECPYCARAEAALNEVRRVYGPETVRIVWKHSPLPFHKEAKPAAEAAQGVFEMGGREAFWKFHDSVLSGQGSLDLDSYLKWAREAGISDIGALREGIAKHVWAAKVDRDLAEGSAAGVDGTPSFFANGIALSGAQPFAEFQRVIDKEIAEAKAKLESGTPRSRLYAERTRANVAPSSPVAPADRPSSDSAAVFKIPIGASPSLGRADAWVTIVEFSDFQCPYCKAVEPTIRILWYRFGDKLPAHLEKRGPAFPRARGAGGPDGDGRSSSTRKRRLLEASRHALRVSDRPLR